MKQPQALDIAVATTDAKASPEHRRFRRLLDQIEKARLRLKHWQEQLPLFAQAHAERLQPGVDRLLAARREWAFELEQLLLGARWTRAEQQTLAQLICDLCGELLDQGDDGDDEIKALYNRVSEVDFDTGEQQQLEAMKGLLEEMSGLDLGDQPVDTLHDLIARAHRQMGEHASRDPASAPARAGKRKTAAQRRAEQDADRVSQTVREVYRKLASALHPDRGQPGATPEQQALRTERMARANAAYAAGDLLALLTLQLQIEQVDVAHAAGVAADQVRHFNKVLAEQLRELEAEIDQRQAMLCTGFGLVARQRLDPLKLGQLLKDGVRELAAAEVALAQQRRALRGPPAVARRWLKAVRAAQRADSFF